MKELRCIKNRKNHQNLALHLHKSLRIVLKIAIFPAVMSPKKRSQNSESDKAPGQNGPGSAQAINKADSKALPKSRRQGRAKRQDITRQWKDGRYDEEHALKERWTREGRKAKPKVQKTEEFSAEAQVYTGLVTEVHRRTCECLLTGKEDEITCRYSNILSSKEIRLPAVGDQVQLKSEDGEEHYVTEVLPRRSALVRPGPDDRIHHQLVLAANIDQVVVVASLKEPDFNYGFVDRFLLAAELSGLDLVLVLNKTDLVDEWPEEVHEFSDLVREFAPVSVKTGEGLDELRKILQGRTSVFTGQSGVGKSSLISKLIPGLDLRVGEVRYRDGKGRHTTTSSSLFDLPFHAPFHAPFDASFDTPSDPKVSRVIDTPGIRGLGFLDLPRQDLALLFPGFQEYTPLCRFSNCLHLEEPGCAVCDAVEEDKLSIQRYDSYLRIMESLK